MTSAEGQARRRLTELLSFYEVEHQDRANRLVHHAAHGLAAIGIFIALRRPLLGTACVASALPISWAGHILFEKNTPAFFDKSSRGGIGKGGIAKKAAIAVGGIIWSAACAMRCLDPRGLAIPSIVSAEGADTPRPIDTFGSGVQHD